MPRTKKPRTQTPVNGFPGNIGTTEPGERQSRFAGQFTGQGLDLDDDLRGENDSAGPVAGDFPGRPTALDRTVSAIY